MSAANTHRLLAICAAAVIAASPGSTAVADLGPSADTAAAGMPTASSATLSLEPARGESRPIGPGPVQAKSGAEQPAQNSGSGWFLRTTLSLGGVITLILAFGAIARSLARGRGGLAGAIGAGGRSPSGVLTVLGRYPISRGQRLVLLQIDRRILLISQNAGGRLGAGGGMTPICEITDPEEVASILIKARDAESESMSERFRTMLGAVDRAFRPGVDDIPGSPMRRTASGVEGDRTELWNLAEAPAGRAIPAEFPVKQPGPPEHDAIGALRRRLAALRSEDGREALS